MNERTRPAEVELEDWEERAAIRQFEGGATKDEAERGAAVELFGQPTLPHRVVTARRLAKNISQRRAQLG